MKRSTIIILIFYVKKLLGKSVSFWFFSMMSNDTVDFDQIEITAEGGIFLFSQLSALNLRLSSGNLKFANHFRYIPPPYVQFFSLN